MNGDSPDCIHICEILLQKRWNSKIGRLKPYSSRISPDTDIRISAEQFNNPTKGRFLRDTFKFPLHRDQC